MKAATAVRTPPKSLHEAVARSQLTNEQIIAKVGCSKRSLTNWKKGQRPSDYYIGVLSEVLGCDLWAMYAIRDKAATPTANHYPPPAAPAILFSNFTAFFGGDENPFMPAQQHIDVAMRIFLTSQLDLLWHNFHVTEDPAGIDTQRLALLSHIRTLESLAEWPLLSTDRAWLTQSLCEAAILAGRIARDQMNYSEAVAQHKRAVQLAVECRSGTHIAAATMRIAETLWDAGLPYEAAGYCRTGLDQSRGANPRIRGELMGFAAEVYGSIGDFQESERLTNEAAQLAIGAASLPTVGGINFSETAAASYLMDEALRQGDTQTALRHITHARELLVIEFPKGHNIRWEAHLWINQARAHSEAREIEAACDDLRHAAQLGQSIGSRIALKKVQDAARALTQQVKRPEPAIRLLHEELMELIVPRSIG
jgi:tetratricopeptide (TPR) repeat protein